VASVRTRTNKTASNDTVFVDASVPRASNVNDTTNLAPISSQTANSTSDVGTQPAMDSPTTSEGSKERNKGNGDEKDGHDSGDGGSDNGDDR
jgi:hypothetical protein